MTAPFPELGIPSGAAWRIGGGDRDDDVKRQDAAAESVLDQASAVHWGLLRNSSISTSSWASLQLWNE